MDIDQKVIDRLQAHVDRGGFPSAEAALAAAVDLLDDACTYDDDWLFRNREYVRAAVQESLEEEARGESYSPDEVISMLEEHRARRRSQAA